LTVGCRLLHVVHWRVRRGEREAVRLVLGVSAADGARSFPGAGDVWSSGMRVQYAGTLTMPWLPRSDRRAARSIYNHLPGRHPAVAQLQGCRQCRPSRSPSCIDLENGEPRASPHPPFQPGSRQIGCSSRGQRCIKQPVAQRLPIEHRWGPRAANVGFSAAEWSDRASQVARWAPGWRSFSSGSVSATG